MRLPFALFILLSLTTIFISCESETPDTDVIYDRKTPIEERLKIALERGFLNEMGFDEKFNEVVLDFYSKRNFKPLWCNDTLMTSKGKFMKSTLKKPFAVGIPPTRLQRNKLTKHQWTMVVQELELTAQMAQLGQDLKIGIMDTSVNKMRPYTPCSVEVLEKQLSNIESVTDYATFFANMGPENRYYNRMAKVIYYTCTGPKKLSAKSFTIPTFKDDSVQSIVLAKEALVEKGFLSSTSAAQSDYEEALKEFQLEHALKDDAKLGKYTCELLGESEEHQMKRAVLSLERWRWRAKFPERYIWVNIPEYMLRLYYNDTLYLEHRVVVGKPENMTPQLSSTIRSIISLPYWTQPQSIASKEFLPAIQANRNYAAKNHYKVYRGDKEVDPSTINWKKYSENNFPFRIKQEPGNDNALGLVKFEFNNKFGVYIHDTPSKSFFNRDVRSFSHGCVRCDMPDSLARHILRRDEKNKFLPDSLDSVISRKEHLSIPLRKPIPIQIDYITVSLNKEWKLVYHADVYKRDEEYLKWMK